MTKFLQIDLSGQTVALTVRAQRRVFKETHAAAGAFWDRRYLPLHFAPNAGARYKYQRRAKSTVKRKKQLAERGIVVDGGRLDLVHTGKLRKAMKQFHVVKAYPKRVTVVLPAQSYISTRPRGKRINMAAELLAVTEGEIRAINAESEKVLTAATNREIKNGQQIKTKRG